MLSPFISFCFSEKKLVGERDLHQSRGRAFWLQLEEVEKIVREDKTQFGLCFDFQKNIPLPLTNVGEEYYKRQLWIHNLGFHVLGSDMGLMFMYETV